MGVLLELVKEFDIKIPQVLIESNIVEVNSENDLNLGVNWTATRDTGDPTFNGRSVFLQREGFQETLRLGLLVAV